MTSAVVYNFLRPSVLQHPGVRRSKYKKQCLLVPLVDDRPVFQAKVGSLSHTSIGDDGKKRARLSEIQSWVYWS